MGQKVNPHGLRVGVIKDWDSRWYARNEKVGDLLVEDKKIRDYLKKTLYSAGIPKIEIERDNAKVRIYLHCARPGVVIGMGGAAGFSLDLGKKQARSARKNWGNAIVLSVGLGCLLVAEAGLGTINQVGLTAAYLHRRGIPLQGIVLTRFQPGNPMHEDNRALCELVSGARVVACVPEGAAALDCTVEELKALYG